jgi:hypothetical protein
MHHPKMVALIIVSLEEAIAKQNMIRWTRNPHNQHKGHINLDRRDVIFANNILSSTKHT